MVIFPPQTLDLVAWCKTAFTRIDPLRNITGKDLLTLADILSVIGNYVKILLDNISPYPQTPFYYYIFGERGNCIQ